ncbi:MAG: zinc metalloprotease HtpX [Pseudomonadota bacterium]
MNYAKTMLLLASLTAVFLGVGWLIGGVPGMAIAFLIAVATNFYAFWNSDEMALRAHGARRVDRASAPELHQMVEELAVRADVPMPAVYVIDTDQPNAFATGRSPEKGAVAATRGIMRMLSREELAGVMAHELAHIKNRDTLIMTVAATVAGAISMLAQFGLFFGGGRDRGILGIVGVIAAAILAPFAAMMIQSLISRTREFSADRLGGEICGNPLWLASALAKISRTNVVMQSAEENPASAHLFIVNPLAGTRIDRLFSTHPDPQRRITELKRQAATMGRMPGERETPAAVGRRGPQSSPWQ